MKSGAPQNLRRFSLSFVCVAVLAATIDSYAQMPVSADVLQNLVNRDLSDIRADLEDGSIDGHKSKVPTTSAHSTAAADDSARTQREWQGVQEPSALRRASPVSATENIQTEDSTARRNEQTLSSEGNQEETATTDNANSQRRQASSTTDGAVRKPSNEMEAVQAFFQAAQNTADKVVEETANAVNDPDPEKFGGPPTDVVVRIITSGGNADRNNPQSVEAMLMMGLLKGLNANKPLIRDIKRGKPLTSLISAQIPTGTTVFPIRVTIASAMGPSQDMDFYFYQDEFGDWSAVEKP